MAHGGINIMTNVRIVNFELIQQSFDIAPPRISAGWAGVFHLGKLTLPSILFEKVLAQIRQRTDHMEFSSKDGLIRHHGADFPAEKNVEQKRFNDIIPMVGKGNFVAALFIGNFKNSFAAQAGTQKTGIFPVEIRMGQRPNVCFFHYIRVLMRLQVFSQRLISRKFLIKTHVNIYSDKGKSRNKDHR